MRRFLNNDVSLLVADAIIIILWFGGLYHIVLKSDLPFKFYFSDSILIVTDNSSLNAGIEAGDSVISIDKLIFSRWEELELYLDGKSIGDSVELQLKTNE